MSTPKAPSSAKAGNASEQAGAGATDGVKASGSGSPGGNSMNRAVSSAVLRRKDKDSRSAFTAAARALSDVVGTVEQAAKKVTLGNIATVVANITRDKKSAVIAAQQSAPVGVTHAYSVVLQHVVAPLWAVDRPPMPVNETVSMATPDSIRLMREMDNLCEIRRLGPQSGPQLSGGSKSHIFLLEELLHQLQNNLDLSTVFIVLLCARLRWIESQDRDGVSNEKSNEKNSEVEGSAKRRTARSDSVMTGTQGGKFPKFEQLYAQLCDDKKSQDDSGDTQFEDRANDENQTADQPNRPLEEVGGWQWKPKGAAMLDPALHTERHRLLLTLHLASVSLTYNYYDSLLQFVVDEIACKQIFLTSFSEGFTQLVAGVKGPRYVAKYITFLCTDFASRDAAAAEASAAAGGGAPAGGSSTAMGSVTSHFSIATIGVDSVLMEDTFLVTELAFQNFVHRNDTAVIVFRAILGVIKRLTVSVGHVSVMALFHRIVWALKVCYIADLDLLVSLVDALKGLVTKPNPVGAEALRLLELLFSNLRDVNVVQRRLLEDLYVGGPKHSFRRIPAYMVASPYCARAQLVTQIHWGNVDQRRGENSELPRAEAASVDPVTKAQFDDTASLMYNHVANIFQALYELDPSVDSTGADDDQGMAPDSIDLRLLFRIHPTVLASQMPVVLETLEKQVGKMSYQAFVTTPEIMRPLHDIYAVIQDRYRPSSERSGSGTVRFRCESPRLPVIPVRQRKCFDEDEMEKILKDIFDDYATSCDARISERDVANLHPTCHMSLRMYVKNALKLMMCGGGGTLRRAVSASLRLQKNYPGTFIRPLFFPLPLGYSNDVCAWIARFDPVYREHVFNAVLSMPVTAIDTPSKEQWSTLPQSTDIMSLLRRDLINDYLTFADQQNEIVIYQAECYLVDGPPMPYFIPFVSNFEIGSHINAAVFTAVKTKQIESHVLVPSPITHVSSFSTERPVRSKAPSMRTADAGSMRPASTTQASSGKDSNSTGSGGNSSFVMVGNAGLVAPPNSAPPLPAYAGGTAFTLTIGDRVESLDRILTRMHGVRGIAVSTKTSSADGTDIKDAAAGEHILDWISTAYNIYDMAIAKQVAQQLLDLKLLTALWAPAGKDPSRFNEAGIYGLMPREELDAQPLCPPSLKSSLCEQSNILRLEMEEMVCGMNTSNMTGSGGTANASSATSSVSNQTFGSSSLGTSSTLTGVKVRVALQQSFFENTLQYNDLTDPKDPRDILSLKLKSTGSPEDLGPQPDPTFPSLVMTVMHDTSRSRKIGGSSTVNKSIGDMLEHFHIKFGDRTCVDPRSVLTLDWQRPSTPATNASEAFSRQSDLSSANMFASFASPSTSAASFLGGNSQLPKRPEHLGIYCMCDGDVFGPFAQVRIRPVIAKTLESSRAVCATATVMSYVKPPLS